MLNIVRFGDGPFVPGSIIIKDTRAGASIDACVCIVVDANVSAIVTKSCQLAAHQVEVCFRLMTADV